jgi:CelD/BcsL family acetyltransferase involved in cellulose biosynthesis
MHVEIISSREEFTRLRADWDAVYAADPEAEYYLSWTWLSNWLASPRIRWLILAAKSDAGADRYVAFFPLRMRTRMNKDGSVFREFATAGSRIADYTGYICLPEHASEVTSAFARQLKAMSWSRLVLDSVGLSESRLNLFLSLFPKRDFDIVAQRAVNSDGVDNSICPRVTLPDSFDRYLDEQLGPSTRQKVRRFLRKLEEPDGRFRITHATDETLERDLGILGDLWRDKWGPRKGHRTGPIIRVLQKVLRFCHREGALFMPVLWDGETPLGALGILLDEQKRAMLFLVSGLDTSRNNPAPGVLLHAYAIRHAIRNGYVTYDFLRGNEPYKYMFGPQERRLANLEIRRRSAKSEIPVLRERPERRVPLWQETHASVLPGLGQLPLTGFALPPRESPVVDALGLEPRRSP